MWLSGKRRASRKSRNVQRRRATAAETLEPRLAMTWAGAPPTSITVPGIYLDVLLNSNGDATGNSSIASTEIDYYKFQALADGPHVISARTPTSNLNTVLGVFSDTGKRLAFNDNISSSNRDSQTTVNLEAGVTYYVGITNRSSATKGTYTWKIDGLWGTAPDDIYEQNDTRITAHDLGSLNETTVIEDLVMRDKSDWFKFSTVNLGKDTQYVRVDFDHRRGDLDIALYNDLNEVIGRSQTRGNRESISLDGLPAGDYWVRVYGTQGAFNPQYSLSVRPSSTTPSVGPTQIDLRGKSIKVTSSVNWDEYISIQTVIQNAGKNAAGSFDVSWYLSQDNVYSPADDILLSRTNGLGETYRVSGVPANGVSPQISVNLQLPETAPVSWLRNRQLGYIIMEIDVNDEVPNETFPDGTPAETTENNFGQLGPGIDHVPIALGRKPKEPGTYNIDLNYTGLSVTQQTIVRAAANRWEQIIIGDLPDAAALNDAGSAQMIDDLIIDVFSAVGDGLGGGLGAAGPLAEDGNGIPRLSFFQIDRTDLIDMEAEGDLYKFSVIAIGRALGLGTSNAWRQWLVQEQMTMQVFHAGPNATAAYNAIFPPNGIGVPVPPFGGYSYWNPGIMGDEFLTPGFDPARDYPISIITIGSLADMGYVVDPSAADFYMGFPMPAPLPGPAPMAPAPAAKAPSGSPAWSQPKTSTVGQTPSATSVDNLMRVEIDYEKYRKIKSGEFDFGYLTLWAST